MSRGNIFGHGIVSNADVAAANSKSISASTIMPALRIIGLIPWMLIIQVSRLLNERMVAAYFSTRRGYVAFNFKG
jgi:hypothetical protein